jgi:hypothetical protein
MEGLDLKKGQSLFQSFNHQLFKTNQRTTQIELRREKRLLKTLKTREVGIFDVLGIGKTISNPNLFETCYFKLNNQQNMFTDQEIFELVLCVQAEENPEIQELALELLTEMTFLNVFSLESIQNSSILEVLNQLISSSAQSQLTEDILKKSLKVLGNLVFFHFEIALKVAQSELFNEIFTCSEDCTDDLIDKYYFLIFCVFCWNIQGFSNENQKFLMKSLGYSFLSIETVFVSLSAIKIHAKEILFNKKRFSQLFNFTFSAVSEVSELSFEIIELLMMETNYSAFFDSDLMKICLQGLESNDKEKYLNIFYLGLAKQENFTVFLKETCFLKQMFSMLFSETYAIKEKILMILLIISCNKEAEELLFRHDCLASLAIVLENNQVELVNKCLDFIYNIRKYEYCEISCRESGILNYLETYCYHSNSIIREKSIFLLETITNQNH